MFLIHSSLITVVHLWKLTTTFKLTVYIVNLGRVPVATFKTSLPNVIWEQAMWQTHIDVEHNRLTIFAR